MAELRTRVRDHVGGVLAAALGILLVGASAWAQAPRRPTFARVFDSSGAPAVGAQVTMVGCRPDLVRELQDVDVVRVLAGRRGRVIAKLQPGLCYVAWAEEAEGAAPPSRLPTASPVLGWFAAGAMLDLRLEPVLGSLRVRVAGLDAWQEHLRAAATAAGAAADVSPKLSVHAMTSQPGVAKELELNEDGEVVRPPPAYRLLEVRLPDGSPLWSVQLWQRAEEIRVPPPIRLKVRVVDAQQQPLAEAQLLHRVTRLPGFDVDSLRASGEARNRVCGQTDADGRCELVVPSDGEVFGEGRTDLLLFAQAGDRPAVAGGRWRSNFYQNDQCIPKFDAEELLFVCPKVEPLRGVLPGLPAGSKVQLSATCKLYMQDRGGYLHDPRHFLAEVAANGEFSFEHVPESLHSCRLLVGPSTALPPVDEGHTTWSAPIFPSERDRKLPEVLGAQAGEPPELGRFTVSVTEPAGTPARGGVAIVASAERQGVLMRNSMVRVPLDERGAATLRLPVGAWVVVAITSGGFGGRAFEIEGAAAELSLEMAPFAISRVTVVDRRGEPVAGARLISRGRQLRGTDSPLPSILQGLQRSSFVSWTNLRSDDKGVIAVPFVFVDGADERFLLQWADGGKSSDAFILSADEPLVVREDPDAGDTSGGR
ncbi:MAG: hypothetical protein AB8H80_05215 [Planctomycetota bacterium]